MIRRNHAGQHLLITQDDHAKLSGRFAEHIGNAMFARVSPSVILACSMHDSGWPIHDDLPTLNSKNLPLDVFETPRPIAVEVWSASTQRTAAIDPYAGLLVSLHSLSLSARAAAHLNQQADPFDAAQMKERFETNKFQHKQIEIQEALRRQLGMRTDIPLTLGLASPGLDGGEDQLLFDFQILQAMDQLSLAVCCTDIPFPTAGRVNTRTGESPVRLHFRRVNGNDVTVTPWLFDAPMLQCTISGRSLPARPWASEQEFRAAYQHADNQHISLLLRDAA